MHSLRAVRRTGSGGRRAFVLQLPPRAATGRCSRTPEDHKGKALTDKRQTSAVFYRSPNDDYPMIVRAQGHQLWDDEGTELTDLTSGISSTALIGQGRSEIAEAVRAQIEKVSYVHSSGATNPAQEELARRLVDLTPGRDGRVMFTSGGSEANELALRIIRQYHLANGDHQRRVVIALHPSYHGATAGALSLTGRWDVRGDYEPFLFATHHIPAPVSFRGPFQGLDDEELATRAASLVESAIQSIGPDSVAAFVAEPISLSTGMAIAPHQYWHKVREICDRHGVLLVADEVITGMGRTGAFFRVDEIGITPDVITLAKGLGAGYAPLGATIVTPEVVETIGSQHRRMAEVHTHSGAPIPSAIGLAVLDIIEREDLVSAAAAKGRLLSQLLKEHIAPLPFVGDIRGTGLMQAVEYVTDGESRATLPPEANVAKSVSAGMWDEGFLSRTMHHASAVIGDVTVFVPALSIDVADLEKGVLALRRVLEQLRPTWESVINHKREGS